MEYSRDGEAALEDNKRHHHSGVAMMTLEPEFSFLALAFKKKIVKRGAAVPIYEKRI